MCGRGPRLHYSSKVYNPCCTAGAVWAGKNGRHILMVKMRIAAQRTSAQMVQQPIRQTWQAGLISRHHLVNQPQLWIDTASGTKSGRTFLQACSSCQHVFAAWPSWIFADMAGSRVYVESSALGLPGCIDLRYIFPYFVSAWSHCSLHEGNCVSRLCEDVQVCMLWHTSWRCMQCSSETAATPRFPYCSMRPCPSMSPQG